MTVYSGNRTFACNAEANVLGTGDRHYLWTRFLTYTGSYPSGSGEWNTKATASFESKFPVYVYKDSNNVEFLCAFVRGEDSLRTYTTCDDFYTETPDYGNYLPHAYLHGLVAQYSDVFTGQNATAGNPVHSKVVDGKETLINTSPHAEILSVRGALGAVGAMAGTVQLYNQSSTFFVPQHGNVQSLRAIISVHTPSASGEYFYAFGTTDSDYRIIYGENFQSGAEWLAWCKTH